MMFDTPTGAYRGFTLAQTNSNYTLVAFNGSTPDDDLLNSQMYLVHSYREQTQSRTGRSISLIKQEHQSVESGQQPPQFTH